MKAMLLSDVKDLRHESEPLQLKEIETPVPADNQLLIRVSCCGVCHTELDEIEGRTPPQEYPVIPGHQVVGYVTGRGNKVTRFRPGDRVGVAWIFSACDDCEYCGRGLENLCSKFSATGRDAHGGYAEFMVVNENFAYSIPSVFTDAEAAPLLCAGAIGYRSLKLTGLQDGQNLGLTGFGASGHLILKMAMYLYPRSKVLVFARSAEERAFAVSLGAVWAGKGSEHPPFLAHAIIDTTPVWEPVVQSMEHLLPAGRLVINAIRKEAGDQDSLLRVRYQDHLWMEKEIKTVANITRRDVEEFLLLAAKIPIKPEIELYPFSSANRALHDLRHRHVRGAKVLQVNA